MADAREQVGEYRLRRCLQTSSTAQVYEVIEPTSHRHFAMKLLLQDHADNKESRRMLFHEAAIGVKLRHDNIINIIKVSKSPKTPNFVMEYFPAGSLRVRLMSKDPVDKEFLKVNAKKIFKQVATGLAYVNSSGVVHCDIKPDNILVNGLVQAKIIDFAIARSVKKAGFLSNLFRKRGKAQGTPSFMSPEQIANGAIDGRADIYSYGATLYELTTGRPPFRGASIDEILKKQMTEVPQLVTHLNPDLTKEFGAFVAKMLEKKREKRHANFHEVLIDLRKIKVYKSDVSDEFENQ